MGRLTAPAQRKGDKDADKKTMSVCRESLPHSQYKGEMMEEHKYSYYLSGTLYFVVLRDDEVSCFSERYGVSLMITD